MNNITAPCWMVRAGRQAFAFDEFIQHNHVAIGWNELGEIPKDLSKDDLKTNLAKTFANYSGGQINNAAGQIHRFLHDFQVDDYVITYNAEKKQYALGKIKSGYQFNNHFPLHHYRLVDWLIKDIDRNLLSDETKRSLGPILSVFKIKDEAFVELLRFIR